MYKRLDDLSELPGKTIRNVFSTGYDELIFTTQDNFAFYVSVDDRELVTDGIEDHSLGYRLTLAQQVEAGLITEQRKFEIEQERELAQKHLLLDRRRAEYLKLKAEFEPDPAQGSLF